MEFLSITTSPVHRLNDDLFLQIFDMNAHMFTNDEALITSRITSQVCHSWRELMLGSSPLWGKLVDFDIITRYKVEALWADELIQRSGSASPIWIKAKTALAHNSPRPQLKELFLKILAENGIEHKYWLSICVGPILNRISAAVFSTLYHSPHHTLYPSISPPERAQTAPRTRQVQENSKDLYFRARLHACANSRPNFISSTFVLPGFIIFLTCILITRFHSPIPLMHLLPRPISSSLKSETLRSIRLRMTPKICDELISQDSESCSSPLMPLQA